MDELKKLLEKFYHAPDSQMPELTGSFFLHLIHAHQKLADIKGLRSPIELNLYMWHIFRKRLGRLRKFLEYEKNILASQPGLGKIIDEFSDEASKRGKRLSDIRHILLPESVIHYLALTNINPNTFGTKIKQFWNKLDMSGYQTDLIKKSPFNLKAGHFTRRIIDQEMKLLSFNISLIEEWDWEKGKKLRDEFDALYLAINQYYRRQIDQIFSDKQGMSHSRMYSLADFENCTLCWRFVPKKGKGDARKPYCKYHSYDPASKVSQSEYNLSLKFKHNKPFNADDANPPPPFPGTTTEIYKLLHLHFPVKDGGISRQDWIDALSCKFSQINLNFFPDVEYDFDQLWRICPNVRRYVIDEEGDDKSLKSILEILDPETPHESDEFKYERKCMHKFFLKNFGLYRLELALAESYLSEYYQYKDNHPQGGKRPGTGGKRKGAGRKPKID